MRAGAAILIKTSWGRCCWRLNEQELNESTAFVLVNGRVLANPSLERVIAEYRRAAASQ
jgi:hypothetical protein